MIVDMERSEFFMAYEIKPSLARDTDWNGEADPTECVGDEDSESKSSSELGGPWE